MGVETAVRAHQGARSEQQDSAKVIASGQGNQKQNSCVVVVADGVGGQIAGRTASDTVVNAFTEVFAGGLPAKMTDVPTLLLRALTNANESISERIRLDPGLETMASTVVAAVVDGSSLQWISVGDSHLYIHRQGNLTKLNQDHSQAGRMVESGNYQPGDPELDQYRHVLYSAVTGGEIKLIDQSPQLYPLHHGDLIVLASDGLDTIPTSDLARLIDRHAAGDADEIAGSLVDAVIAVADPSQDNTTVGIAKIVRPPSGTVTEEVTERTEPRAIPASTTRRLETQKVEADGIHADPSGTSGKPSDTILPAVIWLLLALVVGYGILSYFDLVQWFTTGANPDMGQ